MKTVNTSDKKMSIGREITQVKRACHFGSMFKFTRQYSSAFVVTMGLLIGSGVVASPKERELEVTLSDELTALKEKSRSKASKEAKAVLGNGLKLLTESGIIDAAPKKGEVLKDFVLPNHLGNKVDLAQLRQNGPVVVTFYRGGWCPYCNLTLHTYQQFLPEIKAAGGTLVAISPELPDESLNTSKKNALEFEVLTDTNSSYGRDIGIVFTIRDEIRKVYEQFGIDVEKHNGDGQYDLPLAATFVVDRDGAIVYSFVTTDYTRRAEPSEILNALKSLKK